jgi:hypothetical protein
MWALCALIIWESHPVYVAAKCEGARGQSDPTCGRHYFDADLWHSFKLPAGSAKDPVTGQLMVDPVVTVEGKTRCRFALIAMAASGPGYAPEICVDDVMARNALFLFRPQQRLVMLQPSKGFLFGCSLPL